MYQNNQHYICIVHLNAKIVQRQDKALKGH